MMIAISLPCRCIGWQPWMTTNAPHPNPDCPYHKVQARRVRRVVEDAMSAYRDSEVLQESDE